RRWLCGHLRRPRRTLEPIRRHRRLRRTLKRTSGSRGGEWLTSCGPFLRRYGRLQLVQILVDQDARLAGKIAAEEYERLLGVASLKFCGRRLPRNKGAAEQLIDELERKSNSSDTKL